MATKPKSSKRKPKSLYVDFFTDGSPLSMYTAKQYRNLSTKGGLFRYILAPSSKGAKKP